MKKIVFAIFALCMILLLCGCSKNVELQENSTGTARFVCADKNINTDILEEDLKEIIEIFEGKEIYYGPMPICGFSEDVSVTIDGKTFCIANDDCAVIWLKEKHGYFNISEDENKRLRVILESYGFILPCIMYV